MRQAVPMRMEPWPALRLRTAIQYYARHSWRWWRVLYEYRHGTSRPVAGRKRVLIVRLDAIGDFVLWSGAAKALRRWFGPETHVTLAANAAWADLARDADIADEVWPVRRRMLEWDPHYRSVMQARVHGGNFAVAINSVFSREMMLGDSMVRWSRAPERIGSTGEGLLLPARERAWADGWYTTLTPASPDWMHEWERNVEFLRALGVPLEPVPTPELFIHPRELAGLGDLPEGYFIVFPGASLPERQWGTREFAAVARHVRQRTGWRPVLLGDGGDAAVCDAVAADLPGAINLAGETSVPVFASIVARSRLVLTNETSAVHLAAAAGVPTVCITGGGHWDRFVPYPASLKALATFIEVVSMAQEMTCFKCNWRCVLPHVAGQALPCVSHVPLDRVVAGVDRMLSRFAVTNSHG